MKLNSISARTGGIGPGAKEMNVKVLMSLAALAGATGLLFSDLTIRAIAYL